MRPPPPLRLPGAVLVVLLLGGMPGDAGAEPHARGSALVAVAANMTHVAKDLAEAFTDASGQRVRMSFGASGNLARQILRGAPFELFLSADEAYPQRLVAAGHTRGPGRVYAVGRLALHVSSVITGPLPRQAQLRAGLTRLLASPVVRRIAIANPEHAPYGVAARAVLAHLGLGETLAPRLVLGENVSQTARFAASDDVQAAFLPASLVTLPALAAGRHLVLPAAWHPPLHQRMVLLRAAGDTARAFFDFVLGDASRALLARAGYALPPAP